MMQGQICKPRLRPGALLCTPSLSKSNNVAGRATLKSPTSLASTTIEKIQIGSNAMSINAPMRRRQLSVAAVATATAQVQAASSTSTSTPDVWSALAKLANAATTMFPVFVVGAALLGLSKPASFAWFDGSSYMSYALGVTMLGMGLTLTKDDIDRVFKTPARIFMGFALQYTVMPLLGFLLSRLAGLPVAYAIGLSLVASCPGGTASNVVTYIANADVTLSVAMTAASTLGAVFATPFFSKLLIGQLVPVDAVALLVSTLQVVLFPVLLGYLLNRNFPKAVAKITPLSALSAVLLISVICGSVVAQNASAIAQAGPQLFAAILALHVGGFSLGYGFSKLLGAPERVARTNSIEVGMQNSALGAMLAVAHFPAHPLAAVPCAISACTHSVLGSLLAAYWRMSDAGAANTTVAPVDDSIEGRKAAVQAWIAAYKARSDSIEVRRNAVRAWIAAWKARSN